MNIDEQVIVTEPQSIETFKQFPFNVEVQVLYKTRTTNKKVLEGTYVRNDFLKKMVAIVNNTIFSIIGELPFRSITKEIERMNRDLFFSLILAAREWDIEIISTDINPLIPNANHVFIVDEPLNDQQEKILYVRSTGGVLPCRGDFKVNEGVLFPETLALKKKDQRAMANHAGNDKRLFSRERDEWRTEHSRNHVFSPL